MFEIDGAKNPVYCENLGYLSKLFLDHKYLNEDLSIFLFYILCEVENGEHIITGYFSKVKEEHNENNHNLSCIMTLPFYQRNGYGKFLITFSYELSLIEKNVGSPEKPLSDLGKKTYLAWWSHRLIEYLTAHRNDTFTMEQMSKETGMTEEDIGWTLEQMGILKWMNGQPHLCTDEALLKEIGNRCGKAGKRVKREKIHWIPRRTKWDNAKVICMDL